jgi:GAF domain-containing protein
MRQRPLQARKSGPRAALDHRQSHDDLRRRGLAPARPPWHIPRMTIDYDSITRTIAALTEGETDTVALMATVVCELHHADDRFDWTGFYRVTAPEMLKIGPYQGGHGCLTIPFSRGVCGAAARTGEVQIVEDVDAFPGHIACASSTRSEIVLPVRNRAGTLIAVLDIDSDRPGAFTQQDADHLARILSQVFGSV